MEEYVWADSQVLNILQKDYVVVALYVDDKLHFQNQSGLLQIMMVKLRKLWVKL